jgi:hypothetical protein
MGFNESSWQERSDFCLGASRRRAADSEGLGLLFRFRKKNGEAHGLEEK